jgi:molybdopterin-guanine dinucleotide biosynthesis protein A
MTRLLGAILAGGRSSRFGSDKAEAILDGRRLIDWAAGLLAGHVEAVVVCGRAGGIPDRPRPALGPLGGINAALHHARAHGFDVVLTVPCDVPILPEGTIARLAASTGQAYLASLPVVGVWHSAAAERLDAHIEGGDRSVVRWARDIGSRPIEVAAHIVNINTPGDLALLGPRPRP